LDDLLSEHPKEQAKAAITFSFQGHRFSKTASSSSVSVIKEGEHESGHQLQPAPPMPILSAAPPPINRRRSPDSAAQSQKSSKLLPPPIGNASFLYPPSSAGLKTPTNIMSPNSGYANTGHFEIPGDTTAPLFSARQNTTNYPLSAMARARTPVSAVQQQQRPTTPVSAPVPAVPLSASLPRPPMSASPFRSRDRSDSFKDREGDSSESYRERPPRSARASPIPRSPTILPARSANRPGSAMGQRTPVAVAQREGMI